MSDSFFYLNGRVNAMQGFPNAYQFANTVQKTTEAINSVISRNYECSRVSDVFFSTHNMDILQLGIHNMVLNESNGKYKIGRQSDEDLKVIMRSIYFQYAKNNINDVAGQVRYLNTKVLEWAVPQILTNVKQKEQYIQDISTLPIPLDRSELPSQKGTKSLEIKSFI